MLDSICLHVTNFCNLKCSHCWSNSGPEGNRSLDFDLLKKLLMESMPLGLSRISVSGGEPLLYERLSDLIDFTKSNSLHVVITTNGNQLKRLKELLSWLSEKDSSWLSVRVSIDGPRDISESLRGVGTYEKSLESLRLINQSLGECYVNALVGCDIEQESWAGFFRQMAMLRVGEIALITSSPRGRGDSRQDNFDLIKENVFELQKIARESGFSGVIKKWDYLTVDYGYVLVEHDGNIILPAVEDCDDKVYGNIQDATTKGLRDFIVKNRKILNYDMANSSSCCND